MLCNQNINSNDYRELTENELLSSFQLLTDNQRDLEIASEMMFKKRRNNLDQLSNDEFRSSGLLEIIESRSD